MPILHTARDVRPRDETWGVVAQIRVSGFIIVRYSAEARDAAGHAHVSITSAYLHVAVDVEGVGNLFGAV